MRPAASQVTVKKSALCARDVRSASIRVRFRRTRHNASNHLRDRETHRTPEAEILSQRTTAEIRRSSYLGRRAPVEDAELGRAEPLLTLVRPRLPSRGAPSRSASM